MKTKKTKEKIEGFVKTEAPENQKGFLMASIDRFKQFLSHKGKGIVMGAAAVSLIAAMAFSFAGCTPKDPTPTPPDPDKPIIQPDDPDKPDPDNPDQPDQPDNPDNPDVPDPDNPDQPDNPDNPDTPDTPGEKDRKIDATLGYDPAFDYSEMAFEDLYPSERRVIAENVQNWIHDIIYKNPNMTDLKFLGLEIIPETQQFVGLYQTFTKSTPTGMMYADRYTTNESFTMDTLLKTCNSLTSASSKGEHLIACSPMTNSTNASEEIIEKMNGVATKITGTSNYAYMTYQKDGGGFVDGLLDCGCQGMRISMLDNTKIELYDINMKADGDTKDPVLEHIINGTENDGTVGVGTFRIAQKQSYEFNNIFYNFMTENQEIYKDGVSIGTYNQENPAPEASTSYKIMMAGKVIGVSENGKITMYREQAFENE